MIAVIDYGMGNLRSVQKALQFVGGRARIVTGARDLRKAEKIVFPGVGAFGDAVIELKKRDLFQSIIDEINRGKLFLGLCLGMQLLFSSSEESPGENGLSICRGVVKKFDNKRMDLKIPHMGWNNLKIKSCPLLRGIPDGSYMYFVHSYYAQPEDSGIISATTDYGAEFASVIWQKNVYAMQFHPEKSQQLGLEILKNFVTL